MCADLHAFVYTPNHEHEQAVVRAMTDRWRLSRRVGLIRRDGEYECRYPEVAKPFIADIERRRRPAINLAIRPKRRRR